jgi:hypothetical protein
MTPTETLTQITAEPSAVIRKFKLMKAFGPALKQAGIEAAPLSAAQIEAAIRKLLPRIQ